MKMIGKRTIAGVLACLMFFTTMFTNVNFSYASEVVSSEQEFQENLVENTIDEEVSDNSEGKETIEDDSIEPKIEENVEEECNDELPTEIEQESEILETVSENSLKNSDNKCGDNLYWEYKDNVLTITGSGDMYDYDYGYDLSRENIPTPWDDYSYEIKKIVFSDEITSIGDYAFFLCHISEIVLPASIKTIGYGAFDNCNELSHVVISSDVRLKEKNFSGGTRYGMFQATDKLRTAGPIGGGYDIEFAWKDVIPAGAFASSNIESITFPKELKKIGSHAFYNMDEIEEILLPEGLEEIDSYNFYGCDKLKHIVVPKTVKAFLDTEDYTEYNYVFDSKELKSIGPIGSGCNIEYGWTEEIPDFAFRNARYVTEVIISKGIKIIGVASFENTSIKEIIFPQGLEEIGTGSFYSTDLEEVIIPEGVVRVGGGAFLDCPLKHIVVPKSVESFGTREGRGERFYGRTPFGGTLKTAGPIGGGYDYEFGWDEVFPWYAFDDCMLTYLRIPEGVSETHLTSRYSIWELKTAGPVGGGYNIEFEWKDTIPQYAFGTGYVDIEEITIPNTIKSLESGAFRNLNYLKSVNLPEGLENIGNGCFSGCSSLKQVTIPSTVTTLGTEVFSDCTSLETAYIGDGITRISDSTFKHCTSLYQVRFPNGLNTIGQYAFISCRNLKTINLSTVEKIEGYAFGSSGLENVFFGENVKSIGQYAFTGCSYLKSIVLPEECDVAESVFYGSKLESLTIPSINCVGYYSPLQGATVQDIIFTEGMKKIPEKILKYNKSFHVYPYPKRIYFPGSLTSLNGNKLGDLIVDDATGQGSSIFSLDDNKGLSEVYFGGPDYQFSGVLSSSDENYLLNDTRVKFYYNAKEIGDQKECNKDTCLITFVTNGGSYIPPQRYTKGKKFIPGAATTYKDGYKMTGWYLDPELTVPVGDGYIVNHDVKFYAKWEEASYEPAIEILDSKLVNKNIFYFVDGDYKDANIYFAKENSTGGCMNLGGFYETVKWGGDLFKNPSTGIENYNNDLALLAGSLSAAAEGRKGTKRADGTGSTGDGNDGDYIVQAYKDLGFKDENIYLFSYPGSDKNLGTKKEKWNDDNLAFSIAYIPIRTLEKEYNLVVITARGTTTNWEAVADHTSDNRWSAELGQYLYDITDDFGSDMCDGLDYVLSQRPEIKKNMKILVTGHSLGGAAANLCGSYLNNRRSKYKLSRENIYVYTFGSINSYKSSGKKVNEEKYNNIHDVYNYYDTFGPYCYSDLLTEGMGDATGRFGIVRVFQHVFKRESRWGTSFTTWNHIMPGYLYAVKRGLVNYGRSGVVACPVDVEVYESGNIVGRIKDNEVDESVTSIPMYVIDDHKHYFLPEGKDYDVRITATDDGKMDSMLQDIRQNGADTQIFENISLSTGKVVTAHIEEDLNASDVKMLVVNKDNVPIKEILPDGTETDYSKYGEVLLADIPADGVIPEDLWIAGVADKDYTGKAITQEFRVYYGTTLLKEKTDYTVKYSNNVKAYTLSEGDAGFYDAKRKTLSPAVTIKGKGNFGGSEAAYFKIRPIDVSTGNAEVYADGLSVNYTKKFLKPVPNVAWLGKALKNNTDFTVTYYKAATYKGINDPGPVLSSVTETGRYKARITGRGNFSGIRDVDLTVVDTAQIKLVNKLTVNKISPQDYTGAPIKPALTVKYGGKELVCRSDDPTQASYTDYDYSLVYENNIAVGTGYAVITGNADKGYSGTKRVPFSIKGVNISSAVINNLPKAFAYTGEDITLDNDLLSGKAYLSVKVNGNNVRLKPYDEKTGTGDYKISYSNNRNVGNAAMILTGTNGFSGTRKKTFKIDPYSLNGADIKISCATEAPVAKGGATVVPTVTFKGKKLKEGTDYTVSYKNNKRSGDKASIVINGKGSFKDAYNKNLTFTVTKQQLSKVKITAADKKYQNKKKIYQTKITVTDLDGKNLSAGKDYDKNITYTYISDTTVKQLINKKETVVNRKAGETVDKEDIIPAGTVIKISLTGRGEYTGEAVSTFRITKADITSAKVSASGKAYTGKPITLTEKDIKVTISGKDVPAVDPATGQVNWRIDVSSYSKNINKGKASVNIIGSGNYGGTKPVPFNINAKVFKWWWKK